MVTWNKRAIGILRKQYPDTNHPVSEIAKALNVSESAIRNEAIRLEITRGIKRWKNDYNLFLLKYYKKKGPKWCGEKLGYTQGWIVKKGQELGITTQFDKWMEEDIVVLTELVDLHQPLSKIAFTLNKTTEQIKNKMQKLDLQANHWTQEEIEILKEKYRSDNVNELSALLKRPKKPIFDKACQLGLTNPHWAYIEDKHEYPKEWTEELKREIMERDNFTCQLQHCKDCALCVHHIDYDKSNCDPSNLITLCSRCHPKTNVHRDYWMRFFQMKMN